VKGFLEAADTGGCALKWKTQLLVINWPGTSTQPQLKASLGQQIQGSHFFGQQRGVPVIITEHKTADAQRCGRLGSYRERCERGKTHGSAIGY